MVELLVWGELECRLLNLREVEMCPWGGLAMLVWLVLELLFTGALESETLVWDFLEDWWQAGRTWPGCVWRFSSSLSRFVLNTVRVRI